jgi:hypothetical protein
MKLVDFSQIINHTQIITELEMPFDGWLAHFTADDSAKFIYLLTGQVEDQPVQIYGNILQQFDPKNIQRNVFKFLT